MTHTLHDGTRILLRPIEPGDKARLSAALGRLSRETIRRRFFAATMLGDNDAIRRLMRTITAHLEVDRIDHGVREVVVDLAA